MSYRYLLGRRSIPTFKTSKSLGHRSMCATLKNSKINTGKTASDSTNSEFVVAAFSTVRLFGSVRGRSKSRYLPSQPKRIHDWSPFEFAIPATRDAEG